MVRKICTRLRTSERVREFIAKITRHHLVLGFLVHERPLSQRTIYRYLKLCSPVEVEVTVLTCADRIATRGKNAEAAIEAHLDLARELMSAALRWRAEGPPRPPLRGDELAHELGIEPGPDLGRLLAELEEASYAGEVTSADQAVEYARRLRENQAPR
jgi:poly(A) polymerase